MWVVHFVLSCVVDVGCIFVLSCVVDVGCIFVLSCVVDLGVFVAVLALKVTTCTSGCQQSLVHLAQFMRVVSFSWIYTSQVTTPSNRLRYVQCSNLILYLI